MDDLNHSISQYVKSGQYYTDARSWYANKFVFLVSERTYTILLLSFFVVGLAILGFFYSITNPAAAQMSYISPSPDIAKSYSVIFAAGSADDNPQLQVTKYMLSAYVRKREVYNFDRIQDQLSFVRNTTAGTEYLKYEKMMSINNPSSPMMLYQDANVKEVKVTDVKITQSSTDYMHAMVSFQSSLRNLSSNHVVSEDMVAMIGFKIDDIETLINNNAKKLGFLVLEYSLHKK